MLYNNTFNTTACFYNNAKKQNKPKSFDTVKYDGFVELVGDLQRGGGIHTKGLFVKKEYFEFILKVNLKNANHKVKKMVAIVETNAGYSETKIENGRTAFCFPTSVINTSRIKVKVVVDYIVHKLGTKRIEISLSRNFD